MLFEIEDEFLYDADRLVFIKRDVGKRDVARIGSLIPSNDDFDTAYDWINTDYRDGSNMRLRVMEAIGICLTYDCSFRCNYCSESSLEGASGNISKKDVFQFVADAMRRWVAAKLMDESVPPLEIRFTGGGEPTYHWDLFKEVVLGICDMAIRNDVDIILGLTTNGLLTDTQRQFIISHFRSIMISYDGLPDIHNRNRKSPCVCQTSGEVEASLRAFLACPKLTVRTTLWQDDQKQLNEMADNLFDRFGRGLTWSILPVVPTGRAVRKMMTDQNQLRECDFLSAFLGVVAYAQQKYGDVNIETPIFNNELVGFFCGGTSLACKCPWLLPDSQVITCIESTDVKTVIGHVDNGVVYHNNVDDPLLRLSCDTIVNCKKCIAYRFCKGGCPVHHLLFKEVNSKMVEWECDMIRRYWRFIFETILKGETCFGWEAVPRRTDGVPNGSVFSLRREEAQA